MIGYLIKFSPEGKGSHNFNVADDSSVEDLMIKFSIPDSEPVLVLVNGRHAVNESNLKEGDNVVLMTPVEGG